MARLTTSLFLFALAASSAAGLSTSMIWYDYAGGATFTGRFRFECDAEGALAAPGTAGAWSLETLGGRFEHRTTWVNVTTVDDVSHKEPAQQIVESRGFEPGNVTASWGPEGVAVVLAALPSEPPRPFRMASEASKIGVSEVGPQRLAYPLWVRQDDGTVIYHPHALVEPVRRVGADAATVLTGPMTILLQSGRLEFPDGSSVDLGPWMTHEASVGAGPVERTTTRFVYGLLRLDEARLRLEPGAGVVWCGATSGSGEGTATLSQATGFARTAPGNATFKDRVLSFSGAFEWSERPTEAGDSVVGRAEGDVSELGLDYASVAGPAPSGVGPRQVVGLAAAVLAAWALVKHAGTLAGALYARFGPERALDHPRRKMILESVRQNPGLTTMQLSNRLGLAFMSLEYHVQILRRTRQVSVTKTGKFVRVWPPEGPQPGTREYRNALTEGSPSLRLVVEALANGPRPRPEIMKLLMATNGMTDRGARWIIQRAMHLKLVEHEPLLSLPGEPEVLRCI